ncbi:PKD domain-containing protein [Mitsuaria sp. GD03876]|uniref:PKD domain-containing protein n=1 Tax=Mitsuaria sp. GD03876 TaxID=2975399 RepID=UPI002446A07E|nr:PKD domain-containing protein [Mitsuaria sp. GD03876]MDH0866644.1 PKD domain-containing protein [Mitsuaria sp. GD03876]
MNRSIKRWRHGVGGAVLVLLAACGGGGGDDKPSNSGPELLIDGKALGPWSVSLGSAAPTLGDTVTLEVKGSGSAVRYDWDFGDGSKATTTVPTAQHQYTAAGDIAVKVTITGVNGDTTVATLNKAILAAFPKLQIDSSVGYDNVPILPGSLVRVSATTDRTADTRVRNAAPGLSYAWKFGDGATGQGAATTHVYATSGDYTVELTATDKAGRNATVQLKVTVSTAQAAMVQANVGGAGSANAGGLSRFNQPRAMIREKDGSMLVADEGNNLFRRIGADGNVVNVAGALGVWELVDGTGAEAHLAGGKSMTYGADGLLYFVDGSQIRTMTAQGEVHTLDKVALLGVTSAQAAQVRFNGIATAADGSLILVDTRRVLRLKDGKITTVAGSTDTAAWVDGAADVARFGSLDAVAVRANGEILVLDGCYGLRKIGADGTVSTVVRYAAASVKPTDSACFTTGSSLALRADGSGVMLFNQTLRALGADDSLRTVTTLSYPVSVALYDTNTAWVSLGGGEHVIERVNLTSGTHAVVAGQTRSDSILPLPVLQSAADAWVIPLGALTTDSAGEVYFTNNGHVYRYHMSAQPRLTREISGSGLPVMDGGTGIGRANFVTLTAADGAGNLYFVDNFRTVRRRGADGRLATIAGSPSTYTSQDGTGAGAGFSGISGLTVTPTGTIYVVDQHRRLAKITADGVVTTLQTLTGAGLTTVAASADGTVVFYYDRALWKVEADGSLTKVIDGKQDKTYLSGSDPLMFFHPNGTLWLRTATDYRLVRVDLQAKSFDYVLQDLPLMAKVWADRDPVELVANFSALGFLPDGTLAVGTGLPHGWLQVKGLR